jgi:hypothetical protein
MVCDGSLYSAAVAARGLSAAACKAASVSRHSQKGDLRTRRGDGSPASGTPSRRSARISKIDMTMLIRINKNKYPHCCACFQHPEYALNGDLANLEEQAPTLNGAPKRRHGAVQDA